MENTDDLLTEIRGLASLLFVTDNNQVEALLTAQPGDGEEVRLIRSTFADMFDFGVAYGVSATIEVLQRLEIIERIHPDPEDRE